MWSSTVGEKIKICEGGSAKFSIPPAPQDLKWNSPNHRPCQPILIGLILIRGSLGITQTNNSYYGNNAYREEDNTRVYNRSLKIYWTHCILEFAQIPSKLFPPRVSLTSFWHPSFRSSLHHALITVGCFTGIEFDPPPHITIKGFPWKWSRGNHNLSIQWRASDCWLQGADWALKVLSFWECIV